MKKAIIYYPSNLDTEQCTAVHRFGAGMVKHGVKAQLNGHSELEPCDIAVVFSWNKPYHYEIEKLAGRVLVVSYGFFDRPKYWAAGWDDLSGHADYCNGGSPSDRWEMMGRELKPWRKNGEHVVVTCQVPTDGSVAKTDIIQWSGLTIGVIKNYTDREIRFRPHPLARDITPDIDGAVRSEVDFEEDLKNAWAIVTFNSTSSSMAAIEGIPIFAMDKGSMAWPIANRSLKFIEEPELFDRAQWANNLGYCQWTLDEFRDGTAWDHLKQGIVS